MRPPRVPCLVPAGLLGLVLAAGLAGCTSVKEATTQLMAAPVCCTGFVELRFAALPMGARTVFDLTSASPVMEIEGERGYVAGVELPEGVRGLTVQAPSGGFTPTASYVDARLALLDAGKHVIEIRRDLPLREERRMTFPGVFEWYFGTQVELPPRTRFVVLFSGPGPGNVRYTHGTTTPQPIPASPVGPVALVAH